MGIFNKIYNFLSKTYVALIIMLLFLVGYLILTGFMGGYGDNFLSFGPNKDKNGNYTKFIGLELNTWKKIIIVYFIIFISNILQKYYKNVVDDNIQSFVKNKAINVVPHSKFLTYVIVAIDPFIDIILHIINFFASATFQLQFIIPQFISSYITDLPFVLKTLSKKEFIPFSTKN